MAVFPLLSRRFRSGRWAPACAGAPSRSGRERDGGFTLVEMMVVLVIVGLAAAAVVLAVPDPGGSLQSEAERFAARAKAARDTAIVESRAAALDVGAGGYRFSRRADGAWQPAGTYEWAQRTEVAGGRSRFDTTGLADPLTVTLRRGERTAAVEIRGDGTIHVRR